MRYYIVKHINYLEIREDLKKKCYSAFSPDDRLLKESYSLAEILIYATNNEDYKSLRAKQKVTKKDIKTKRIDQFNIKLTAKLPNNKEIEVISKFPTIESAKKDLCYKINSGKYDF